MLIAMILQMPIFFKGIRLILCHKLFLGKVQLYQSGGGGLNKESKRFPKINPKGGRTSEKTIVVSIPVAVHGADIAAGHRAGGREIRQ